MKGKKRWLYKAIVLLIIVTVLIAGIVGYFHYFKSSEVTREKNATIVTAKTQPVTTNLFYDGTLQPINVYPVTSPADGLVDKINFTYGGTVKKNSVVVVVDAAKLQDDFRSAVASYLTAKDKLTTSKASFQGNKALYKAKVISEEEYQNSRSTLENDQLSLLDAEYKLQQAIAEIPGLKTDFKHLTLEDINQVKRILAKQYSYIELRAKTDGVALTPDKTTGADNASSDEQGKKIHVGSDVKKGQVMVAVGDLSGLSVQIQVNEIDINKIKTGQKVTVTSPALPGMTLKGVVSMVGSQAESSSTGQSSLASFPVTVKVPKITVKQRGLIRVGMSAKVAISITGPSKIILPIDAVYQEGQKTMVKIVDPQTNAPRAVEIAAGQTTPEGVVINQGVKAGDKVIVNNKDGNE